MLSPGPHDIPSLLLYCPEGAIPAPLRAQALQCVADADELIRSWLHNPADVVVVQLRAADHQALPLCIQIRQQLPEAPLLVLLDTASVDDWEAADTLLASGVQEVMLLRDFSPLTFNRLLRRTWVRRCYDLAQHHSAQHDPLTGLANRTLFQDRLDHALISAQRQQLDIGLLFVDIDRFRVVNELYGHAAGDELLLACAFRLQTLLRRCDTVARLTGNAFAIILENIPATDSLRRVATKVAEGFEKPFQVGGHEVFVSLSMGMELASRAGYSVAQLLRNAELALHQAKGDGRNNRVLFEAGRSPADQVRLGLESALHHALERQELTLVYQPQAGVSDNGFRGVEVLLRWQHPVLGQVSPAVFIPVLEENGLIERFGEWVLRQSCQQFAGWLRTGALPAAAKLSVNLSPRQFRQQDLLQRIRSALQESGLPPGNLTLEITEGTLMRNLQQGVDILNQLRALGVAVAIDDFGTGYSSLAYLKDLPIDYLKIDRVFVQDIVNSSHDAAIASSIISLAHNLGLTVIAEGVEDSEILEILRIFNCDQYQGFYLSRPVDAGAVPAFFNARCA